LNQLLIKVRQTQLLRDGMYICVKTYLLYNMLHVSALLFWPSSGICKSAIKGILSNMRVDVVSRVSRVGVRSTGVRHWLSYTVCSVCYIIN
jgi:hypothetical protein